MMEIVHVKNIREYKRFTKQLYANDPLFKDNKSGLINIVCKPGGVFYSNSYQEMIAVDDEEKRFCQCVLICHKEYPDTLTIAFFEAAADCKAAVDFLIAYAIKAAKALSCTNLVVSLDGHYNYSVGFLNDKATNSPSFGASYNPGFYNDYFAQGFDPIEYVSFVDRIESVQASVDRSLPYLEGKYSGLTFELADLSYSGFKKTISDYTYINNLIFKNHKYYYTRTADEDIELFSAMRLILKPENLIYAKIDGKIAGFILWYPDFNELVSSCRGVGVFAFLKYKYLRKTPKTVKVVEIGVLPEYEGSGVILLLLAKALNLANKSLPGLETIMTGWILEANKKSMKITQRLVKHQLHRYTAYEKQI